MKMITPVLLGTVAASALASGASAAEIDLSPLVNEAIADILVPVALAVVPTVGAMLVLPLRRFLDQRAGDQLAKRVDDLLNKAIAYAAQEGQSWVGDHDVHAKLDGLLVNVAADYAVQHAPDLMKQAGALAAAKASDAAKQAADALLQQKIFARLSAHPDVQALKAILPPPAAPMVAAAA